MHWNSLNCSIPTMRASLVSLNHYASFLSYLLFELYSCTSIVITRMVLACYALRSAVNREPYP
jgi:hypothetical protein